MNIECSKLGVKKQTGKGVSKGVGCLGNAGLVEGETQWVRSQNAEFKASEQPTYLSVPVRSCSHHCPQDLGLSNPTGVSTVVSPRGLALV